VGGKVKESHAQTARLTITLVTGTKRPPESTGIKFAEQQKKKYESMGLRSKGSDLLKVGKTQYGEPIKRLDKRT